MSFLKIEWAWLVVIVVVVQCVNHSSQTCFGRIYQAHGRRIRVLSRLLLGGKFEDYAFLACWIRTSVHENA